jgi:hypothetical protein
MPSPRRARGGIIRHGDVEEQPRVVAILEKGGV